ncbi:hypothetical protein AALP_AA8G497600 [Arabis alpina]|uniref:Uncharacterized protein n=1 Tax=Arabis alpina TaxID=50452 RepID=A0A087GEJ2_ARAAL|nr:hypothetical protein AALP_AA8G497600 [Arabis alpina]
MVCRSGLMAISPILSPRSFLDLTAMSSHLRILPEKSEPPDPPIPPDPPPLSWLVFHDLSLRSCTTLVVLDMLLSSSLNVLSSKSSLERPIFLPCYSIHYSLRFQSTSLCYHLIDLLSYLPYAPFSISPVILVSVRDQKTKLLQWPLSPCFTVPMIYLSCADSDVPLLMSLLLSISRVFGALTLDVREHLSIAFGNLHYLPLSFSNERYVWCYALLVDPKELLVLFLAGERTT